MRIASIVGARPQFIKIAPLCREFDKKEDFRHLIIHTGQHYDYRMSKVFFDELGIPEPDFNLEVGSGNHGWQTGEMTKRIEEVLLRERPDYVIVYGDTNSTLAGALAASKLQIPLAHVEAGLRSYNKKMPEEINRVVTDHLSDILFCPMETAVRNLEEEGFKKIINNGKLTDLDPNLSSPLQFPVVINVGDIMYDSVLYNVHIAQNRSKILDDLNLVSGNYVLATVHRAENTDNPERLNSIFQALDKIASDDLQVIVPLHPRTHRQLKDLKLKLDRVHVIDPVSYFEMLVLEHNAKVILTDSGGVQRESYWFQIPCIILREETEWMELVEGEFCILAGADKEKIIGAYNKIKNRSVNFDINLYGNGKAGKEIGNIIESILTRTKESSCIHNWEK